MQGQGRITTSSRRHAISADSPREERFEPASPSVRLPTVQPPTIGFVSSQKYPCFGLCRLPCLVTWLCACCSQDDPKVKIRLSHHHDVASWAEQKVILCHPPGQQFFAQPSLEEKRGRGPRSCCCCCCSRFPLPSALR